MRSHLISTCLLLAVLGAQAEEPPTAEQKSEAGLRYGVLATGAETFLLSPEGKTIWTYPLGTRDGWMLPNGNLLLDITRCDSYPHGAVLEVNREGKTLFEFKGSGSEVDCVQPLREGHILLTESGPAPRLLEIDRTGKILVTFPLKCQTSDFHMQTRMARKLANGHYLVPHLTDKVVREYDAHGNVVWEVATPNWPFTAVRLGNGNTLINCTRGDTCIEVDQAGKIVWQVINADLPGSPIHDACGVQRLANGDTVIESYGAGDPNAVKLFEVTRDKKIVWTLRTFRAHGLHGFQLLDDRCKPLRAPQLR